MNEFESNAFTESLFQQLDLDHQWYAMDYILNLLSEEQKIQVRKQLQEYKKEQTERV